MTESFIVEMSLGLSAHEQAKKFSCNQVNPQKAKQVYLNTLAVMAVNNYLNYLGWTTSLTTSDSWNQILQTLMDVADLDLPDYGKLECRFVLAEQDWLEIPAEVSSERIGYIVVQLQESLVEANILGFVSNLKTNKISLNQLQPLRDLPDYLSQIKQQSIVPKSVQLSRWLEGIMEAGWQQIDNLSLPSQTVCFRGNIPTEQPTEILANKVNGIKTLEFNPDSNNDPFFQLNVSNSVALIISLISQIDEEIDISVKVCPTENLTHLPPGLEITILDEQDHPVMQAQAKNTETIEFNFSGVSGEFFKIKLSLNNCHRVEHFII